MKNLRLLIEQKDYAGIRQLLSLSPQLANEGMTIPFDDQSTVEAHPLHRICDAVFVKKLADKEAIEIAKILLESGANIEGAEIKKNEDTPLLAAASLHAEQLGIFYIEQGANIHYTGRQDGATALHWAAFCGRDQLVEKLIIENAAIDQPDKAYNSTPLAWAIHALMTSDTLNSYHQPACIKLLLKGGADARALNSERKQYLQKLAGDDVELQELLALQQ